MNYLGIGGVTKFARAHALNQPHPLYVSCKGKMDLTTELSSTADSDQSVPNLHQQLECENEELRQLCGHLDQSYQRSRQLGLEWQSFGKYTAEILKEEMASSESKDLATRGELDKLVKENRELKEMCLYLDQSRDGSEENSLTPPEAMELIHGRIVEKMNKMQRDKIPRYTGLTSRSTLQDSHAIRKGKVSEVNREMALAEMKKRLDRVETERLELIKVLLQSLTVGGENACRHFPLIWFLIWLSFQSLSAAHTLAADAGDAGGGTGIGRVSGAVPLGVRELPAHLQHQLDSIRKSHSITEGHQERRDIDKPNSAVSSDVILHAVTVST